MEGRDIGTAVFPNADVKIFLDADPTVRAERRVLQNGPVLPKRRSGCWRRLPHVMSATGRDRYRRWSLPKTRSTLIRPTRVSTKWWMRWKGS